MAQRYGYEAIEPLKAAGLEGQGLAGFYQIIKSGRGIFRMAGYTGKIYIFRVSKD